MTDVHDEKTRSYNMSRVKGKNTKPEILVRKYLFSKGFRFRVHVKKLPGNPDIVLPKYKTVVFVNGCFWHGHEGCRYYVIPKTRTDWWINKLDRNKQLDKENIFKLKLHNWNVITIFECELKRTKFDLTLENLILKLKNIHNDNSDSNN